MGRPKALLMWDKPVTFLEKIIREYLQAGCDRVICTVNRQVLPSCKATENRENVKFILNPHPERSRMHSVKLGLREAAGASFCFIENVDNPFVHSGIIRRILEAADPGTWCSPEHNGRGGHPVLLPEIVMDQIRSESRTDSTLQEILERFPKKVVEMEDDLILRNINTPEDYRNFFGRNP